MSDEVVFVSAGNETAFVSTENATTFVQVGQQGPSGALTTVEHIGDLIAGATPKTTPVDADSFGLSDSESAGILRKFTWASLKDSLNGIFARLAGIAGGQTLIGGTGAGDSLKLQGTAGTGGSTDKAIVFKAGTAGDKEYFSLRNDGALRIGDDPGYSPIAVQNTNPGTIDVNCLVAKTYSSPVSAASAPFGVNTVVSPSGADSFRKYGVVANMTVPQSNTLSVPNLYSMMLSTLLEGSGATGSSYGIRGVVEDKTSNSSGFIGGVNGFVTKTGSSSLGTANALFGQTYLYGGTTTSAWGTEGVVYVASGATLTNAIGVGVSVSTVAGGTCTNMYGVNIGGPSDTWSGAGSVTNSYALYIGSSTNVGTNKWSIYNQSAAGSYFAGSIALGVTAASAKLHSIATTEQLRLGYDASNYASYTVSSAGVLTIATTGTAPALYLSGKVQFDKTVTAAGTTGAQTINKTLGSVNFAAAATSLVVTNNLVSTSSVIVATVGTNDTTMKSVSVVAAAGSFTLYANAAATAETRVNFHVFN